MTKEQFCDTPMGKALFELSNKMQDKNIPPISINVIGGFALMMHGIRDKNAITDIDYVGETLSDQFNALADKIGIKHKLGSGWINNEVMLSGITMDDFEQSTGKLTFHHAMQIGNISINVLDEKDLLRMKIISIDTSLMGIEYGGDFSRLKDLPDVIALLKRQNMEIEQAQDIFKEYIMCDYTIDVIKTYEKEGQENALDKIKNLSSKSLYNNLPKKESSGSSGNRSEYVNNLLNSLMTTMDHKNDLDNNFP